MFNSTHAAPGFQAKTAHINPKMAEGLTLMIEAYPGGPIRSVPNALYDRLLDQVKKRIPEFIVGEKYTATDESRP